MKLDMRYIRFIGAAVIVMALGALAGWYLFVSKQIDDTKVSDEARGFGETTVFGDSIGSGISNLLGGVVGDILQNGDQKGRTQAPRLWQITRTPVAGLGFASSTSILYFAERASGNVLTADPRETKIVRLTNTLIPKVHEALFAQDGSVILRGLSETGRITTYAASISTSSSPAVGDTPHKLIGTYLPEGITSIATRPSSKELFFLLKEGDGAAGMTSNWLGASQKRIFASSLSDWDAILLEDGSTYVVQKPSDGVAGYAFRLTGNGSLERHLGNVPGLMLLPKSSSQAVAYSTSDGSALALYARVSDKSAVIRLPVRTSADKCVWAPDSRLILYCAVPQAATPGAYLQGRFDGSSHTIDAWWKIDVSANTAEQEFTPDGSIALDVESPYIDSAGVYIGFINGLDKTLWMLTLEK